MDYIEYTKTDYDADIDTDEDDDRKVVGGNVNYIERYTHHNQKTKLYEVFEDRVVLIQKKTTPKTIKTDNPNPVKSSRAYYTDIKMTERSYY